MGSALVVVFLCVLAYGSHSFKAVGFRTSSAILSLREPKLRCEPGAEGAMAAAVPEDKAREFDGIRQYKDIFGNLQVPADFVVPTADFSWPEETWGMPLGKIVDTIKNTDEYDLYKNELENIGFRYSAPAVPEQTMEGARKDFDFGNIITIGLYSWIAYLAYDTARIVFFSGPPPTPVS